MRYVNIENTNWLLDVRFVAVNDNFDTLTAERSSDGYIIPLKNIIIVNDITTCA